MSRYLQKISLKPYSESEIWTGWELVGRSGEIEGLLLADHLSPEELRRMYGVEEFLVIPEEYLDTGDFLTRR
ncbi:MAG TPA: hypothetical protein VKB93_22450 [Thermoanaerobaculia bacterium]|nr:hypothetical protein [Thermoanaerobaculia bacterium]